MELKLLDLDGLRRAYRALMPCSFPPEERKPQREMEEVARSGRYLALGALDAGGIVGMATAFRVEPGWALFDYLCVAPERRNGGLGARLVRELTGRMGRCVLFGESESPAYAGDPALAARRLDFYRRCGAREAGYEMALFGVVFRVLYWADRDVPAGEILRRHEAAWRDRFTPEDYARFASIPWTPADGVLARIDWSKVKEEDL